MFIDKNLMEHRQTTSPLFVNNLSVNSTFVKSMCLNSTFINYMFVNGMIFAVRSLLAVNAAMLQRTVRHLGRSAAVPAQRLITIRLVGRWRSRLTELSTSMYRERRDTTASANSDYIHTGSGMGVGWVEAGTLFTDIWERQRLIMMYVGSNWI